MLGEQSQPGGKPRRARGKCRKTLDADLAARVRAAVKMAPVTRADLAERSGLEPEVIDNFMPPSRAMSAHRAVRVLLALVEQ